MMYLFSWETTWDIRRGIIIGSTTCFLLGCFIYGYIQGIRKRGCKWVIQRDIMVYNLSTLQIILRLIYSTLYSYFLFIYASETLRLLEQVVIGLIQIQIGLLFMDNRAIRCTKYTLIILFFIFLSIQVGIVVIDEYYLDGDGNNPSYECQTMKIVHAISHFVVNSALIVISLIICSLASTSEHALQLKLTSIINASLDGLPFPSTAVSQDNTLGVEIEENKEVSRNKRMHPERLNNNNSSIIVPVEITPNTLNELNTENTLNTENRTRIPTRSSLTAEEVRSPLPKKNRRILRGLLWMFVLINLTHLGWDISLYIGTRNYDTCNQWMGHIGDPFEYTMLSIQALILCVQHIFIFIILAILNIGGHSIPPNDMGNKYTQTHNYRDGDGENDILNIDKDIDGYDLISTLMVDTHTPFIN